jgi:hypothetical protein
MRYPRERFEVAYLFISHDLTTVATIADRQAGPPPCVISVKPHIANFGTTRPPEERAREETKTGLAATHVLPETLTPEISLLISAG